jgi:hypothetical protein
MHVVEPPPTEPAEGFRVFVVFSGLAGAWQTVKMLNGRIFGGREVASILTASLNGFFEQDADILVVT